MKGFLIFLAVVIACAVGFYGLGEHYKGNAEELEGLAGIFGFTLGAILVLRGYWQKGRRYDATALLVLSFTCFSVATLAICKSWTNSGVDRIEVLRYVGVPLLLFFTIGVLLGTIFELALSSKRDGAVTTA